MKLITKLCYRRENTVTVNLDFFFGGRTVDGENEFFFRVIAHTENGSS